MTWPWSLRASAISNIDQHIIVMLGVFVSPMKIRVLSISSGPLGPHASCVHEVSLVHARCVRSQGSSPRSGAPATNFHPQWSAAGSWRLGGEYRIAHPPPRHQDTKSYEVSCHIFEIVCL